MPKTYRVKRAQKHLDETDFNATMAFVERLRATTFGEHFSVVDDGTDAYINIRVDSLIDDLTTSGSGLPSTSGKFKYMVLSLIDDALTIDWDWPRFHA